MKSNLSFSKFILQVLGAVQFVRYLPFPNRETADRQLPTQKLKLGIKPTFFSLFAIALTLIFALNACSFGPKPSLKPLRVGITSWAGFDVVLYAQASELFKQRGIEVELVRFDNQQDSSRAVMNNRLDAAFISVWDAMQVDRGDGRPVILMTTNISAGSDGIVDKVKGLSLGAVDYITKPVQHEEALARIRVHLKLRDAQKKVEQRTIELSQALNELKHAQVHLVQSEKMSSLGQLVAGVAHEINNPLNFISANLPPAKEHIQDLMTFLELYEECHPQPHPKIQAWMDDVDVEYLREDLLKLLNSMQLGSDRICQLVLSLRNFSRLDEAKVKPVDIHEGIDSTLLILQHRLKACAEHPNIQVIKDYGQLPMVECYPSQLNQVFMNLLSNAIDALEDGIRTTPTWPNPTIAIHTFTTDTNWVTIAISDNGTGICEEVRSQLFDPFFTTKPVGKGTGLGLSISHQIVTERHRGKIDCYSKQGQGSEFVVQIPVRQRIPQVA